MIRRAKPQDIPRTIPLALEALRTERYPTLLVSRERIEQMMRELVSGAQHYAAVCEEGGEIVGAIGALVSPGLWHERSHCNCVMFFCKKPGEGIKLCREFLRWARSRPAIKMITVTPEFDADERIIKMWKRLGLNIECCALTEVR